MHEQVKDPRRLPMTAGEASMHLDLDAYSVCRLFAAGELRGHRAVGPVSLSADSVKKWDPA